MKKLGTVNRGDFGHGVTSDNYYDKLQMHELRKKKMCHRKNENTMITSDHRVSFHVSLDIP